MPPHRPHEQGPIAETPAGVDWSRYERLVLNELERNARGLEVVQGTLSDLKTLMGEIPVQRQITTDLKDLMRDAAQTNKKEVNDIREQMAEMSKEVIVLRERFRMATAIISVGVSTLVLLAEKVAEHFLNK